MVEVDNDHCQSKAKAGEDGLENDKSSDLNGFPSGIVAQSDTARGQSNHEKSQKQTNLIVDVAKEHLKCKNDEDFK
jgi:hypothetical protein